MVGATPLVDPFNAVHRHILQYAAHFAGYDEHGESEGSQPATLGSGTFVRLPDKRVVVATCGHVIRRTPHGDPIVMFQFLVIDHPHLKGWQARSMMKWGGDGGVDQKFDLGTVEVDLSVPGLVGAHTISWDRLYPDWEPKPGDQVMVYGMSKSKRTTATHPSGREAWSYGDNPAASEVFPLEKVRCVTKRPEIDLFFRYDATYERRGKRLATPSHEGMSGGGVWLYERGRAWLRLVAIIRDACPEEGWIRATRIKWWMDQVEGRWPESIR